MHTIDLLRGQGIPAKTTLGSAGMVVVMVVVPILAAAVMVDRYMQNITDIEIKQQTITTEEATIAQFADAVKDKESLEKEQIAINSKLSEVSLSLGNYIQWSPVLETLAKYMPAKMVMSSLSAASTSQRQKVESKTDPGKKVNVTVTQRTLVLDISGSEQLDYGSLVKTYANNLKKPQELGPILEDIVFSQKPGSAGDLKTVSYTMNLIFKSGTL